MILVRLPGANPAVIALLTRSGEVEDFHMRVANEGGPTGSKIRPGHPVADERLTERQSQRRALLTGA